MYNTIVIDPPWNEQGGGRIKRGADRHYPLVKTADMPGVILGSGEFLPNKDCHLYMWATVNHLPDAIWLMGALGFQYKTNAVWIKSGPKGLGQYFRGQHEHLLFGTRGRGFSVKTDLKTLGSVIHAPRGKHSHKPAEAYELIEARSIGPRLEMFARDFREGWLVWGNEIESELPEDFMRSLLKPVVGWQELRPLPAYPRKCSGCDRRVRHPESMIVCGKESGRLGVRLCRKCVDSTWEMSTSADDSPNLRKCRCCGQRKQYTAQIDGWNSICGECMNEAGSMAISQA